MRRFRAVLQALFAVLGSRSRRSSVVSPIRTAGAVRRQRAPRTRNHPLLIVTRNLPPLNGGMERLNWHLAHELSQGFEVGICGPRGSRELSPANAPVLKTFASRPLPRFMLESLAVTLTAAWRFRPDLVIAGSGVTAPHAWLASRLTGARMLVYLHGLDLIAEHPLYRILFLPSIRRADRLLVNSRNTARLAREAGIAPERIEILHPGVTLPPEGDNDAPDVFRGMIGAEDRPLLLSVGRLTARKGLLEFIRHALPAIAAARPDVLLVVIGGEASEKLGASRANQREAIRREAENLGLGGHLRLLGHVDDDTLAQAYRTSQIHLFPVLDLPGDVEGFGMVAVEAAAHGLPTVAFAVGGVPDAVAPGVSGLLIPPGGYQAFATAVIELLEGRHTAIDTHRCRDFASRFGWEQFGANARRVCADLAHRGVETTLERRSHAVIDLPSRHQKARKIERLLGLTNCGHPLRLLEVGTGCGGIAHYFATHPTMSCVVDAVDVVDQRSVHDGYRFRLVEGISLPYPDDSFDVVLTNHVIEHVGIEPDQKAHLREIHRVLKHDGIGYLAVPNRWMMIEPHYRLFGLSWLPRRLRTPYLRWRGRGSQYDCEPLTLPELERLLSEAGFRFENIATRAFRETVAIEGARGIQWKLARLLPDAVLDALARLIPTLIYALTPLKESADEQEPNRPSIHTA